MSIKSIEKNNSRKDISLFEATLEDGSTVSVEADSKKEAESKLKKYLEDLDSKK